MDRIKLKVLGVASNQVQNNAFILILAEENGTRRIPVVIGQPEAQSIALLLEKIKPPRPFTYDLMLSFATAYNINITEVLIYKLENGVFFSALFCDNGQTKIKVEARSSDAVALALRFNCPIFTTPEILEKAGIEVGDEQKEKKKANKGKKSETVFDFWQKTVKELEKLLATAIETENYELASVLKEIINHKKQ